jgi:hypothetical protein
VRRALAVVVVASAACAPPPAAPPAEGRAYPGVLHPPATLGPDFSVSQHVEAISGQRTGAFDGVLQKRGDELVVVGLGPAGVRAFVLRQVGGDVSFEQSFGPALPFPPRNILVDVHRAFFKRLAPPASGAGTVKGDLDGEAVLERWAGGELVERSFTREGERGAVRITYEPGCTRARCAPSRIRIVNEWFGYSLTIDNGEFTWL